MWYIVYIVLFTGVAKAMTDAEAKADFVKILLKCNKDNSVSVPDLMQLHKMVSPTKNEVKCLLACGYRTIGTMDDKGMYNVEAGYKVAKITADGDEARYERGKKLTDVCAKVNDQEVADGEKGCDRAALIFDCVKENAPKLGFKI